MILKGINTESIYSTNMAEEIKKPETVKTETPKPAKGNPPDPSKKILLKEHEKRLDPNAPDTYNEIDDIEMDDIDEESLPKIPQSVIDEALKKHTKPS
ncbi:uncharacterized protein LOC133181051 [Saccostrea echinata]|uniref:uncharacterized protein LOC133181051 n=1 Tax=Saccostrea echinata TaxID=191078 RepID=UPI002A80CD44|nr:uncharacterized protein LOC133181051 [Saccostrea echinata]